MKVILLEKIKKLGTIGDIVNVKSGYARNFLLPKEKAMRATKMNIESFEIKKASVISASNEKRQEAEKLSEKITGVSVNLIRQAGESGHLYGSVRPKDISDLLEEKGFHVTKAQIHLANPIKVIGVHEIEVWLHPEVHTTIRLNIAQSLDEALAREEGNDEEVLDEELHEETDE